MVNVGSRIVNGKEWRTAMTNWVKAQRTKGHDECINKFAGESCFKAMMLTPKARVGKINAYDPAKGGRTYKQKLLLDKAQKI